MRIIKPETSRRMPWLNGDGETTELAIAPEGATFATLDWRLSAAHVAKSGPFSHLAGIDRTLVVTSGHGMTLTGPGMRAVTLTPDSAPVEFAGELAIEATLTNGPVDDLNVMTRRSRYRHKMAVRQLSNETVILSEASVCIVSLRDCDACYQGFGGSGTLRAGDFAILASDEERLVIHPDAPTRLYDIRIWSV